MRDFAGKVAVVTGATRGIGRALAERCLSEGMKTVLVGRNEKALLDFQREADRAGGVAVAVPTDVSRREQVEALLQQTLGTFGSVNLLVNNAGVGRIGDFLKPAWESPLSDWEQILAVNLWGVIYAVRAFVPQMLKQNDECYVVNVASIGGLAASGPGNSAYSVSKYGVVALSETLYRALRKRRANVRVAVVCPADVSTDIVGNAVRSWEAASGETLQALSEEDRQALLQHDQRLKSGMPPAEVADYVFRAMREERFYVLTHPETKEKVRTRMEDILQGRNPTDRASTQAPSQR